MNQPNTPRICECGGMNGAHHIACPEPTYQPLGEVEQKIWDHRFELNLQLLDEPIPTETLEEAMDSSHCESEHAQTVEKTRL